MIILTPKQENAVGIISKNTTTLLEGGSRSGKTYIAMRALAVRAYKYPGSWHLGARLRLSHARYSLWMKTLPDVLKGIGVYDDWDFNHKDLIATCPNGSQIWIGGLDDKERTEKILGNEYATIFLNEVSQIGFDSYETVTTRLNPGKNDIKARMILDYNPPSKRHWGWSVFHERKKPDGSAVPEGDYAWLQMNPVDNLANISDQYMGILQNLSGAKRLRFLEGKYGAEEGSLWKREWLRYGHIPVELIRVVVAVDPSGSKKGDEIGIIVAGIDAEGTIYILADYSLHGTPEEWSREVFQAYDDWKADAVVAEKNFGGDMVESVISDMGRRSVNYIGVTASRGKVVRAEPISALYQQNIWKNEKGIWVPAEKAKVVHNTNLIALEDEICTWKQVDEFGKLNESPNRLDALVWAVTELMSGGGSLDYVG